MRELSAFRMVIKQYPNKDRLLHRSQALAGTVAPYQRDRARRLQPHNRVLDRAVRARAGKIAQWRARAIELVVDQAASAGGTRGIEAISAFPVSESVVR